MTQKKQLTIYHQDLFPTRVWTVDLSVLAPFKDEWMSIISDMQTKSPVPAGRSNRMGWNSQPTLFEHEQFAELADAVRGVFDFIFKEMGPPNFKYKLEAWANTHTTGGYNTFHTHPGALLSACYYLHLPKESGGLVLKDPRPGAMLSPWQGSLKPNSGSEITIMPQEGQLIIFPNWLEHATEANRDENTRISIPVNALLSM
jgi:uncharacterized protein (TIGR02466 family)